MAAPRAGHHGTINQSSALLIKNGLKFYTNSSTEIQKNFSVEGSRDTCTTSVWIKRGGLDVVDYCIWSSRENPNYWEEFTIYSDGSIFALCKYNGATRWNMRTSALLRDPSAWYHLVYVRDTSNATQADRIRIYINGERVTSWASQTEPASSGLGGFLGGNFEHKLGKRAGYDDETYDGLMAEFHFLDGIAVNASGFGFTDPLTNTWRPKKYTGNYGTNGLYYDFSDPNDLGADRSGNGNDANSTNPNLTVFPDSPSGISFSTDSTSGITTVSQKKPTNWCTLNRLSVTSNLPSGYTKRPPFDGNLTVTFGQGQAGVDANFGITPNSGKFYWEVQVDTSGNNQSTTRWGVLLDGSNWDIRNAQDIASVSNGDVLGFAVDANAGTANYYKNGTLQGSDPYHTFTNGWKLAVPWMGVSGNGARPNSQYTYNFGQQDFAYAPPSGFLPLCTANLPTPTSPAAVRPDKYFNTILYTGNGGTKNVSGTGFKPDLVWIRDRDAGNFHCINDTVRGAGNYLSSNTNNGENDANGIVTSLDPDGFSLGFQGIVNDNNVDYVAWCWKAGGDSNTFNIDGRGYASAAAAGLDGGTITPTGASVNTESGFSIIQFTGTGAIATLSHGMNNDPKFILIKRTNVSGNSWAVYHDALGADKQILLNSSNVASNDVYGFNDVPSSGLIRLGSGEQMDTNQVGAHICYAWSEVPGYSKFGSYVGNANANGTFVHCGFKPAWLMVKNTTTAQGWYIVDNKRDTYNPTLTSLAANDGSNPESSSSTGANFDFLSNGFKLRSSNNDSNGSDTYIYAAWAAAPTQNLFGGQANAR